MVAKSVRPSRRPISPSLRFEVLRRCNFACYYCGVPAPVVQLQVEHVIPVSLGGTNDPWNLVSACWDCNSGKGNGAPTVELVRQVREEYACYSRAKGFDVQNCYCCQIPIVVDEDDEYEGRFECWVCNGFLTDAYDVGRGTIRERNWYANGGQC